MSLFLRFAMKNLFSFIASCVLLVPTIASAQAVNDSSIPAPIVKKLEIDTPSRVLFIGNSLMYYNGGLQTHTHRIAASIDTKLEKIHAGFKSVHITGATLEPYPVDYLTAPGNLGIKDPFQVVVLAGSSRDALSEQGRLTYRKKVLEWNNAMKKHGGSLALVWLQAPLKPKLDQENYRLTGELILNTANEVGALVIPIAPAFAESYRQRPDLELQMKYDGNHATLAGQYLSAAVLFAALYQRTPEGSGYTYFGALDKSTVEFLQKVAMETVKKFLTSNQ